MKPLSFMLIAGETSGDTLAGELVHALRNELAAGTLPLTWDYQPLYTSLEPKFFGAGGARMAAAGVELAFDLTAHSVTGISDVVRNYRKFRRFFAQLYELALKREPDAIICVDFSGFNLRFGHAIRHYTRSRQDWFHDWNPKLIQYVSPQVWASRPGRAYRLAEDFDLLVSIFPFESQWYQARVPKLRVEFVGNPAVDRYGNRRLDRLPARAQPSNILLLPGSRPGEIKRHLSVIGEAWQLIRAEVPQLSARMVLPNEAILAQAKAVGLPEAVQAQAGGLAEALGQADLAIASTGTVTLECALFGVPTVALYKTSWATWQIARRIVTVKYAAKPNLLADEEIFPEFIQNAATPANLASAALALLRDVGRREKLRERLGQIVGMLGPPGAAQRAAKAVLEAVKDRAKTSSSLGLVLT